MDYCKYETCVVLQVNTPISIQLKGKCKPGATSNKYSEHHM